MKLSRPGYLLAMGVTGFGLIALPAFGQTLEKALANAYLTNPEIQAGRAELRGKDETVNQAISNWRPNVEFSTSFGYNRVESNGDTTSTRGLRKPKSVTLSVEQNLYRGGRTGAEIEQRELEVRAERARLADVEQDILLQAATAYSDVFRDQAVLRLTRSNEKVLKRQLEATQDRFSVGEVTRTDVSQAEARVARAKADRIQAEGDLEVSRTQFERLVGIPAGTLAAPGKVGNLPKTLKEAVELSITKNPDVVAAQFEEKAAKKNVAVVKGELLPEVTLDGEFSKAEQTQSARSTREDASIVATIKVPLYQQGEVSSRLREAKQLVGQRRLEFENERRAAREAARSAWELLSTARARIEAFGVEIKSNGIALDGVKQEAIVGSRTVLDVLDAEQELLDSQVNLVRAQRDEFVAAMELLGAVGRLTAKERNLPVDYYNELEHYNKVRDKFYGFGK